MSCAQAANKEKSCDEVLVTLAEKMDKLLDLGAVHKAGLDKTLTALNVEVPHVM